MKICTAEQMRAIDAAAIGKFGIPSMVVMENAGNAVLKAVEELRTPGARVLITCGGGNNGGDGFVVARHLHNIGADVQVALLAEAGRVAGDAGANFSIARKMGVPVLQAPSARALNRAAEEADILVDGVLGTGIHGVVRGPALTAIKATQRCRGTTIAIDIPSGVCADTGQVLGEAVQADITVTFALPKIGLYTHPGRAHCGDVRVADIGIPASLLTDARLATSLTTEADARGMLPARLEAGHKGDFGRVTVIGGSPGMTGAVTLAARAALRCGAGLVTVCCAESLNPILEAKLTEAMTRPLTEAQPGIIGPECVQDALAASADADAVVIGPGLSREPAAQQFAREFISACDRPLLIDADALHAIGANTQSLQRRSAPTILTPHPGEASRLSETSIDDLQSNRLEAARGIARRTGAVVVLKGAATVTADPDEAAWINPTGSNALGTGGTGDVLAGAIAALAAGGATPIDAAVAGAYFHGAAGDLAAQTTSARGTIAGDVCAALARVLSD